MMADKYLELELNAAESVPRFQSFSKNVLSLSNFSNCFKTADTVSGFMLRICDFSFFNFGQKGPPLILKNRKKYFYSESPDLKTN